LSDYVKKPNMGTPFDLAVQFLSRSQESGGIYGIQGSGEAFVLAGAIRQGSPTILRVQPEGEAAAATATDLRFYIGGDELSRHPLRDPILRFPSTDALPYSFSGYETDVRLGRMSCLFRLSEGKAPRVLTVGVDALMTRIMPRWALRNRSFSLAVGQEVSRDVLLEKLVSAGYSRAPLVEDAGDFSVRGFIIDVYPPVYPYPARIEQMGDRIESIRFFDPTDQRSRETVSEIQVGPTHMVVPDANLLEEGLAALVRACEDRGVEKRVRQHLVDDFRHGIKFPGAESYLPYFFPEPASLLDYLPPDSIIVLPDEDTLGRALEDLQDEVHRQWQSAAEDGLPVPDPDRLYLSRSDLNAYLERFRTVVMSRLEVEDPHRLGIRVPCEANTDIRVSLAQSRTYDSGMTGLVKRFKNWREDGVEVFLVSHTQGQANRLLKLLEPYDLGLDYRGEGFDPSNLDAEPTPGIRLYVGALTCGFRMESARRVVVTEEEIFGSRIRSTPKKRARGTWITSLNDLSEGEAVVHEDYGIGIFRGLARKEFEGIPGEVMVIEYSGGDLLYHPVERLQVIQKYVSGAEEPPRIDRLGGRGWEKTKAKVKKSIREMARELLEIYAKRKLSKRTPYSPTDENFAAFEATFEFEETPDQAKAIEDVMEAMDSADPMDQLVCGDVGYGKTEVALRAAFRAVMDGKQVAILVPTTVLAQQHYDTFTRRFNGYPINVELLSRSRNPADQKEVLKRVTEGKVDLIVGTHKILQKNVTFRDLGLLVVDEEHRFGVAHKEKIKKLKAHLDVLTLTATPIPRTLNLSLTGIRELSVIETPPTNRQSIRTHVVRQSDEVIREALTKELSRGGQAFYLHNRVRTIHQRAGTLNRLVPEGRFAVAHGQMSPGELERVMLDFVRGNVNVLVCTSIIESGLDIPRANTIIIERADTFGLADLYQLRGRVGRSHVRAYAYLLTPPETLMTPDAVKRLAVIQEHSNLGQGFRIAMRDMEIRGAGNILGTSQSGHVAQVGYEMYLDLLEQAVQEIKGEEPATRIDPEIGLKMEVLIPESYVPDPQQRMNLYKRLSRATEGPEIDGIEDEMFDLYGKPPEQVFHLIQVMRIRLAMKEIRILRLDYNQQELIFTFDHDTPLNPQTLVNWTQSDRTVRLIPSDRLACTIGNVPPQIRIDRCFDILKILREAIDSGQERILPARPADDGRPVPKFRGLKKR
jgi:transcription-repair coupling factor (superfamily II helicase)